MRSIPYILLLSVFALTGCIKTEQTSLKDFIDVSNFTSEKGSYLSGEEVIFSFDLTNAGDEQIDLAALKIEFRHLSDKKLLAEKRILEPVTLGPGESISIKNQCRWTVPENLGNSPIGLFMKSDKESKNNDGLYISFIRVVNKNDLTSYQIQKEEYEGLNIFTLDGGMSAEYVVEKSLENLATGLSHSWKVNAPGSGPNHVYGTPQFLEKSVKQTVDYYDEVLGENAVFENVIISPGIPSIPYISNALNAPVLPLHFLVSVQTVKEIRSILDYSISKGIASYSTLSHDPSVPYAVAWVKLLDLPSEYKNFIERHKTKNVIIVGSTGTSDGETKAKRIIGNNESGNSEYQDGSIYIMYPGTSHDDVETLENKIVDLKEFKQQEQFIRISDWESGINQRQISNFKRIGEKLDKVEQATVLTSNSLGDLYDLGTYSTLALMSKNTIEGNSNLKGVIFNPYLTAHPIYELQQGYLPLVYWQLVPAKTTVDRAMRMLTKIKDMYDLGFDQKSLIYWVNCSRNFGASFSINALKEELSERGYKNLLLNNPEYDDVWNPNDGMNASTELIATELAGHAKLDEYSQFNKQLTRLSLSDLIELISKLDDLNLEVR